jgi:hypothetical protein
MLAEQHDERAVPPLFSAHLRTPNYGAVLMMLFGKAWFMVLERGG